MNIARHGPTGVREVTIRAMFPATDISNDVTLEVLLLQIYFHFNWALAGSKVFVSKLFIVGFFLNSNFCCRYISWLPVPVCIVLPDIFSLSLYFTIKWSSINRL